MSVSISERYKVIALALAPDADRYTGDPQTDWIRCDYSIMFVLSEGVGGTGTATITISNATDNAGNDTADIAFRYRLMTTAGGLDTWGAFVSIAATGYLTIAGAAKGIIVEVRHDELDDAKPFVAMTLTESVASAVDAGVIALVDSGFTGDTTPSVL